MSGKILAIDTTSEWGSIALVEDCLLIEEIPLHSSDGFAHVLFGEIETILAKHRLSPRDIGVFAAASGPGSFTGVRVGLTAVKGLAEAAGRKAAAVSNLQALASFGTRPLRAAVIDARRGEIYGAVYNDALELADGEVVMDLDAWLATLPPGEIEFITAGVPLLGLGKAPVIKAPRALAGAVGRIAAAHLTLAKDPEAIDANYVRRPDIRS